MTIISEKSNVQQIVPKTKYTMTVGHCFIQLGVWGAVSPQRVLGPSAPGKSEDFKALYYQK